MVDNTYHRTSGTIEAWNYILKHTDHPKHRLRPDVFVKQHFPILLGRQMSFVDSLKSKDKKRALKVYACRINHFKYFIIILYPMKSARK